MNSLLKKLRNKSHKPPSSLSSSTVQSTPSPISDRENDHFDGNLLRVKKFSMLLGEQIVELETLRKLAWNGVPYSLRPIVWKLLIGYFPANVEWRDDTISRKRKEYFSFIPSFFENEANIDENVMKQINSDIPRTFPTIPLFHHEKTRLLLRRVLYVWSARHPAISYVQGLNDIFAALLLVFLSEHISIDYTSVTSLENADPSLYFGEDETFLEDVEADCYWCISRILEGIQDVYTFSQPGVQRAVRLIDELVERIDLPLSNHLKDENVLLLQFSFRWINCLFLRDFPLHLVYRIWDSYLAEGKTGFSVLHTYTCVAFLLTWSEELRALTMPSLLSFLQHLPTQNWTNSEIEVLLSRAYLLVSQYQNAQQHLRTNPNKAFTDM